MARKVLISFLGTNNYIDCNYYHEADPSRKIKDVKYIQEALVQLYCQDFTDQDVLYFFLTDDARKKNWENDGYVDFKTKEAIPNKGLKNRLSNLQEEGLLNGRIEDISIEEGFTTEQIWAIFATIFECLEPDDEIIFDITHAFRSLPMLGMTLINYAKVLKSVTVKQIHYGAFEALGTASDVGKKPIEERNAAILNLVSFSELQEWTKAANIFTKYGNSKAIVDLAKQTIIPILREKQSTKTDTARKINKMASNLELVTDYLSTNRGKELVEGKIFETIWMQLSELSEEKFIAPMQPILNKVKEKIAIFSTHEDCLNGFKAVEWCIEHGLVQQGITMLQETLFTYFCVRHNLDYKSQTDRDLISTCFWIKNQKAENDQTKWNSEALLNLQKTMEILNGISMQIAADYDSLTQSARNDINHGGFSKNASPQNLKKKLIDSYDKIKSTLTPCNPT